MKKSLIAACALAGVVLAQPVLAEEVQQEPNMNVSADTFNQDLRNALQARYDSTVTQLSGQSADQVMGILTGLAAEEQNTLAGYASAAFEGNAEYLRKAYMEGLSLQASAPTEDAEAFWKQWNEGAEKRAYVVVELYQQSDNSFLSENQAVLDSMIKAAGELPTNEEGSYVKGNNYPAWILQYILKDAGLINNPDGDPGNATITALKQFEENNGVALDGVINWNTVALLAESGVLTQEQYETAVANSQSSGVSGEAKSWAELTGSASAETAVDETAAVEGADAEGTAEEVVIEGDAAAEGAGDVSVDEGANQG